MSLLKRIVVWSLVVLVLFGILIYFRLYSSIQLVETPGNNDDTYDLFQIILSYMEYF